VTDILRSKKYRQLSDKEIIRLHSQGPKGEAKYFLEIEIDIRQLGNTVALSEEQRLKRNRHSLWYYLFYALMLMLALGRYGGKF
jgi:hypothetical protein